MQEIRTFWSLADVMDQLEAFSIQDDADWLASNPKGKH